MSTAQGRCLLCTGSCVPYVALLLSWHPFYVWLWDMRFPRRATPGSTSLFANLAAYPRGMQSLKTGFPSLPFAWNEVENHALIRHSVVYVRLVKTRNSVWARVWLNSVSAPCRGFAAESWLQHVFCLSYVQVLFCVIYISRETWRLWRVFT
jgi:hypothetical protein